MPQSWPPHGWFSRLLKIVLIMQCSNFSDLTAITQLLWLSCTVFSNQWRPYSVLIKLSLTCKSCSVLVFFFWVMVTSYKCPYNSSFRVYAQSIKQKLKTWYMQSSDIVNTFFSAHHKRGTTTCKTNSESPVESKLYWMTFCMPVRLSTTELQKDSMEGVCCTQYMYMTAHYTSLHVAHSLWLSIWPLYKSYKAIDLIHVRYIDRFIVPF